MYYLKKKVYVDIRSRNQRFTPPFINIMILFMVTGTESSLWMVLCYSPITSITPDLSPSLKCHFNISRAEKYFLFRKTLFYIKAQNKFATLGTLVVYVRCLTSETSCRNLLDSHSSRFRHCRGWETLFLWPGHLCRIPVSPNHVMQVYVCASDHSPWISLWWLLSCMHFSQIMRWNSRIIVCKVDLRLYKEF